MPHGSAAASRLQIKVEPGNRNCESNGMKDCCYSSTINDLLGSVPRISPSHRRILLPQDESRTTQCFNIVKQVLPMASMLLLQVPMRSTSRGMQSTSRSAQLRPS